MPNKSAQKCRVLKCNVEQGVCWFRENRDKEESELDVNANVVKSNHYSHQIDRNTVKPKFTIDLMVFQKQCDHT